MFRNIWGNKVGLVVLLVLMAMIVAACCVPPNLNVRIINDTFGCSGGCTITVTFEQQGGLCVKSITVGLGQTRTLSGLTAGNYRRIVTGTCFNNTFGPDFLPAGTWDFRYFCGLKGAPVEQLEQVQP